MKLKKAVSWQETGDEKTAKEVRIPCWGYSYWMKGGYWNGAFGSGSEASGGSCTVVVVGKDLDEELPINIVIEKYAEVGMTRDGVEPTVTASVCVWIVGLVAVTLNWAGECGTTTGTAVGGACELRRRLWMGTLTAVTFLAPRGLGLLLLKLNGLAKPLL